MDQQMWAASTVMRQQLQILVILKLSISQDPQTRDQV